MLPLLDDPELFRRLVGFDSVSRNGNLPIADFIADYLTRPGIRISRNPSDDDTRVNLIVEAGPSAGAEREGLVLSGHMDVVPADEPEWESDPFELIRREDHFVGRGAADMKGFLALAINRLATLEPHRLRAPLALLLTFDEELGTLGARHFVGTWPEPERLPRRVVVGEPTSLRAVAMHKGHLKLGLAVRGQGAHSGYPHLGRNAIEPAARAVTALSRLRAELEAERPDHAEEFPEVPYVAVNVAQIEGGTAINVVPDRCLVRIGIRILPGMGSDQMVERFRSAVGPALSGEDWSLEVDGDSPPFRLDPAHPLHQALCAELGQDHTASVSFATDAGWLQTVGFDCVILGPGSIEVAHKPNETLAVDEFRRAGTVLDRLITRFCRAEPG